MIITMELKKITNDHYIIVDDSEISIGDIVAEKLLTGEYELFTIHTLNDIDKLRQKKITHSTRPLEWFGGEIIFLSEVKELIGEVDVFTVVEQWSKSKEKFVYQYWNKPSFIEGYNQALEDNKEKKYTEEDMKVAITQAFLSGVERLEDFERVQEMILDNIKPKTEWEVEFIDGKLKLK